MEIKTISRSGINFLALEEGVCLKVYKDTSGIWTIGIGCTYYENGTKVKKGDPPITYARAVSLFRTVLPHYELTVWSTTRDDLKQNQFDACVSLCFNIGVTAFKESTLLRIVNKNLYDPAIIVCFERFRYSGGKPVLLARRKREAQLYFS